MDLRLRLALLVGKIVIWATHVTKSGGTAAPGLIATKIDPNILAKLSANLASGAIVVTGTNGKTTTSRILSTILKEAGFSPIHNRSGSNLIRGLVSTLIQKADLKGRVESNLGLFEVDEFTLPTALSQVQPKVVIINNLFRDQLDRYGEVETVRKRWAEALGQLPVETIVILNSDDPSVAHLGHRLKCRVLYFGLADKTYVSDNVPHAADSTRCQNCLADLAYESYFISHLGIYSCPKCGLARPDPQVFASEIKLNAALGSDFLISQPNLIFNTHLNIPGLYNIYNALAAVTAASALKIEPARVEDGLKNFKAAFGRIEQVQIGEKTLLFALVKNPVGFNEVLRMIFAEEKKKNIMIGINDFFADGRDVSWLWDVDIEIMKNKINHLTVTGSRAEDMALRIKYGEIFPKGEKEKVLIIKPFKEALEKSLSLLPKGEMLYVLPTYTAMLQIRKILSEGGHVERFWEE
jgi:UDP-N-acetylmuramyl tripeptide synthase